MLTLCVRGPGLFALLVCKPEKEVGEQGVAAGPICHTAEQGRGHNEGTTGMAGLRGKKRTGR